MRIHIDNLRFKAAANGRELDLPHVNTLAEKIAKYGLLQPLVVVKGGKVDNEVVYDGKAGFHREAAICKLRSMKTKDLIELGTRHDKDNKLVPGRSFEDLFPDEKIECIVLDADVADAALDVENTARKDYTQPELWARVDALTEAGVDQHEIAARLSLNQGRISEFLSFRKCIPQAHDAWVDDVISHRDMMSLAALSEADQKVLLGKLTSAGRGAQEGDEPLSPKAAKQAKAEARKELHGAAKATKRTYQNAGKPSRKRLTTLAERVDVAAKKGDEQSKSVFSIVGLVFGFIDGRIDEKAFGKKLAEYGVVDVLTDPEKPKKEPKPAKVKADKPEAEPKPEKPKKAGKTKAEKPAKASTPKAAKKASKKAGDKKPGKPKSEKPKKASKAKKAKKSA